MGVDVYIYYEEPSLVRKREEDDPDSCIGSDAYERLDKLSSYFFRRNDIMHDTFDRDRPIEQTDVENMLRKLMSKMGDDDCDKVALGEVIMVLGYLLKENRYPIWIDYST